MLIMEQLYIFYLKYSTLLLFHEGQKSGYRKPLEMGGTFYQIDILFKNIKFHAI